jgi:integrase
MAGQIIRRGDNNFMVRVFLGRDPQTGKRRYHNKTVRGPKKDAQRYLNGVLRELDLGTFVEPSTQSFGEYLDEWLKAAVKPRVSEGTLGDYTRWLDSYVRPVLGARPLVSVRAMDIQKVYAGMQERGLSASVVRNVHAVVNSALAQAVKWDKLARNPAQAVELPKLRRVEMRALSPEEAQRFLEAARGDKHYALFSFALATGMRPNEYLGLQWKDVDWQRGTATVQRVLKWRQGGGWYFKTSPKTAAGRRALTLPASTLAELSEHRRRQNEQRLKWGADWQQNDLVFCGEGGTPLTTQNLLRRHFKPILTRAGLPAETRIYDLRHTHATLLLMAGEHPKVVSERLGHASVKLTLDVYSHVLPTMQQGASEKIERMLYGGAGTLLAHKAGNG